MTGFVIGCAAMLVVALVWLTVPLWRTTASDDAGVTRSERRISGAVVTLAVSVLAVGMYATLSNWNWKTVEATAAQTASIDAMLQQLEAKLAANPQDVDGWLMLGRSYAHLQRYARAVDAYQQAYDLTKGENVEAMVGLGEALALLDETS
ncbi:MAG TPA: tetratricopeptide repeat protein, partial [Povalibacter sp.]|nr:tetratricopeptide repeat protein [Povalibacter sp.]